MRPPVVAIALALAVMVPLTHASAQAQVPQVMNYQVMLTDTNDEPLPGMHELVFRIYTLYAGGSLLWSETQNLEANSIGVVSAVLGSVNPISILWDAPRWLEIEVDGEIMSPRRRLTTHPYAFHAEDSNHLGGIWAAGYATDTELSSPGVINTPGNPVDWTRLKNVPAGFADGADDTGGTGDGHSLDASDGSPVDAVYVDQDGNVGIGTTAPQRKTQVHSAAPIYLGFLQLTTDLTGTTADDGLVVGTQMSGLSWLWSNENQPVVLGTGNEYVAVLQPGGIFEVGSRDHQTGILDVYRQGVSDPVFECSSDANGGYVGIMDEAGNLGAILQADGDGTGGRLVVAGDAIGMTGIDLNGNWGGSEDPVVRVLGSSREVTLDMTQSGDASVQLPADAIRDGEILNEPGVANYTEGAAGVYLDSAPTITTIASQSIDVPSSGYVLAIATCQLRIDHDVVGDPMSFNLGVSDANDYFPTSQDLTLSLDADLPTGLYDFPVTVHGLFEVALGTHTFYFLGTETDGLGMAYDRSLTLVFLPTAYGTTEPPLVGDRPVGRDDAGTLRGGLTDAEIAAEQAETEAFRIARLERELVEMRAEFEAMKEGIGVRRLPAAEADSRKKRAQRSGPPRPATPRTPAG
jgi:hypothetical protein